MEEDFLALREIVNKWRKEGRGYDWIEAQLINAGYSKAEVYEFYYGVMYSERSSWFYYFVLGLLFSASVELVFAALRVELLYAFFYSAFVLVLTVFFYVNKAFKSHKRVPMLTGMAVVTWVALIVKVYLTYFAG
ncbi:MAG: hypothetical protein ABH803_03900 [Candidatus Micrarchaeota archaeon]